jgi:CubicO group peptidase (beta-lactamase class C family)
MRFHRTTAVRYRPDDVVSIAPDEAPPLEAGLTPSEKQRLLDAASGLYATGVYPGVSLCVMRRGQVLIDRAWGHVRGNSPDDAPETAKVALTPRSPVCIFSASKAVTGMLVHHCDDRGLLHVDDRIVDHIPAFGRHGKDRVTIRHLLTHRAGLPSVEAEFGLEILHDPAAVLEVICDQRLSTAPGRRLAYHAITGGFVLGEILRRVTGQSMEALLEEVIRRPLGLNAMQFGWAPDRLHEVAENAFTGYPIPDFVQWAAKRSFGARFEDAATVANTREWLTSVVPSGNIVSTARDVARFFEMLRLEGTLDGVRVFQPRTVRRALIETAYLELDLAIGVPIRQGSGMMLGQWPFGIFGPDSPRAFGHLGFTNILTWADPDRAISVALLTTGKPLISNHILALVRFLLEVSRTCRKVT